jgi:hypothetical protein
MITYGPIEIFFRPPTEPPSNQGDGILFHLRYDLQKLYGKEDDFSGNASNHAMLAMMGMLAGIDYLSKVYSSKSGRGRFVETVKELCNINEDDSQAIFQLRCALMHSVSLSIISKSYRKNTKFNFEITNKAGTPLISKLSDSGSEVFYRINFWELKRCFKKIIDELLNICKGSKSPKNSFVVNKIGQMHSEKLLKT